MSKSVNKCNHYMYKINIFWFVGLFVRVFFLPQEVNSIPILPSTQHSIICYALRLFIK